LLHRYPASPDAQEQPPSKLNGVITIALSLGQEQFHEPKTQPIKSILNGFHPIRLCQSSLSCLFGFKLFNSQDLCHPNFHRFSSESYGSTWSITIGQIKLALQNFTVDDALKTLRDIGHL
jgi:hypothetical protein